MFFPHGCFQRSSLMRTIFANAPDSEHSCRLQILRLSSPGVLWMAVIDGEVFMAIILEQGILFLCPTAPMMMHALQGWIRFCTLPQQDTASSSWLRGLCRARNSLIHPMQDSARLC